MNEQEPDHHVAYRKAWEEYCTCFDPEEAKRLENAMDQAQNHFGWDEFQTFKVTLKGYIEYWGFSKTEALKKVKKLMKERHDGQDAL